MNPLLLSVLCLAAGPSAGSATAPDAGTAAPGLPSPSVVNIETTRDAAALCRALAPAERVRFPGDAVERGKAEAEHEVVRDAALAARYRVIIPGARLAFEPYDPEEKRLAIAARATLPAAGGKLRLWPSEGLEVEVEPAAARRILEAQKRRALSLALVFEVASDDGGTPCTSIPATGNYTLSIDPVGWEFTSGGAVLARGGEGSDRPLVSAAQGARRRVEVAPAMADSGAIGIRRQVQARAKELEGCYAGALARNPSLDGSLVLELRLGAAGGAPEKVAVVADSIQDDAMAACVKGVIAQTRFPSGKSQRATVPVHFLLDPPDESGSASR